MAEKRNVDEGEIRPGMEVEAEKGDLGEEDVSSPHVTEVVENEDGSGKKLLVTKGVVFKKKIEVPVDRVQDVVEPEHRPGHEDGKVVIDATAKETEGLNSTGIEKLEHAEGAKASRQDDSFFEEVEQNIPTAEGLRRLEEEHEEEGQARREYLRKQEAEDAELAKQGEKQLPSLKNPKHLFRVLGPGLVSGIAGNDSSAVATYSIDGASNGYAHLWVMLLATPLFQTVQYSCAKIGRITQMGLAELLRTYYGRWAAILASLILILANVSLISANLVAIGSGLELLTGLHWTWFVVPIALILWYMTVYRNFESLKRIFIIMSLAFIAYVITALFSGAHWLDVLKNTFIPHLDFNFTSISTVVALLGATISPYTMFWQVQGEKEEARPGTLKQQLRFASIDIGSGVVSGNLVAYFIIVATSATLNIHHITIATAADAAKALVPILGPFGEYLFAIGFIGAGLVAIPVLLASTSYAVAGTFGWPASLSRQPWQNEGFYLILTLAMLVSLVVSLVNIDPLQLIFWANILAGVLSPILVIYLIVVGNNRKIMRQHTLSLLINILLVITAIVMFTATALLFYGLATGQH